MRIVTWGVIISVLALSVPTMGAYIAPSGPPCSSVPCGVGPGPAGALAGLTCASFDQEYMRQMFQLNHDISEVAVWGTTRLNDPNLTDFAKKIYRERGDMNADLSTIYAPCGCGKLAANNEHARVLEARLASVCGITVENAWVITMKALLDQSKQAGILAEARATTQALRGTADNTVPVSDNEIGALARWQQTTFLTHQQEERFCGMHPSDPRCP